MQRTIFIADDDSEFLDYMKLTFKRPEFVVETANTGYGAIGRIASLRPSLR